MKKPQPDHFRNLWENNANVYEFFDYAKSIGSDLTFAQFDHAWQYCTILSEDFDHAYSEFWIAITQAY